MKTFFITGGAGFLGCTLVRKLLERGEKVIVYDNFSFGRKENIQIDNLKLECIEADIIDTPTLKENIQKYQPDVIIHLAALHFIPYCNLHKLETLRVNVEGTQSLLESIRNVSVSKVIAASSAAVYGISNNAHNENDTPDPYDIYGISKLSMEQLVKSFYKETGKVTINVRLFNIYGPYETNPHLIPRIMEQFANSASKITLGNLSPKRDYIYVEDVADALILISDSNIKNAETYNIGTEKEYSATEIVEIMNKITGRNVMVESVAQYQRKVDREHLLADTSKIKEKINWELRHSIEEGLRKTAAFYGII